MGGFRFQWAPPAPDASGSQSSLLTKKSTTSQIHGADASRIDDVQQPSLPSSPVPSAYRHVPVDSVLRVQVGETCWLSSFTTAAYANVEKCRAFGSWEGLHTALWHALGLQQKHRQQPTGDWTYWEALAAACGSRFLDTTMGVTGIPLCTCLRSMRVRTLPRHAWGEAINKKLPVCGDDDNVRGGHARLFPDLALAHNDEPTIRRKSSPVSRLHVVLDQSAPVPAASFDDVGAKNHALAFLISDWPRFFWEGTPTDWPRFFWRTRWVGVEGQFRRTRCWSRGPIFF